MKINLFILSILLAISTAWLGCNKAGKLNKPSESKPPTGAVELKLKWPAGERIEQDMDMKMTTETTVPGLPNPVRQDITMGQGYGLTVLQANPDGSHEIEMDFLSARMSAKAGEKTTLDYDSTKTAEAGHANPLAQVFGKIVGSKIRYFLNESNEVEHIEGVDELMTRLSSGSTSRDLAPLKSTYNEGYFKELMSANRFLPSKPVQPGDTWTVQYELPMGMMGTMVMNIDITFANWEMHGKRNTARLEFQGTIKTKPDSAAKAPGMSISIQDGSMSGVSWFDPELGITIDTTMNQDLKMDIQVPQNPRAKTPGNMQNLTSQMKQAINIKLVSVK
jgi:hypothetical protein